MTKTENYQLNQWDAADPIRREDFNSDNAAIDAALNAIKNAAEEDMQSLGETVAAVAAGMGTGGKNCRIAWGTYTGTGTYGADNPTRLTFDFCPMWVFVASEEVYIDGKSILMRPNSRALAEFGGAIFVTWEDLAVAWYTTATVNQNLSQNNTSGYTYHWVAIGYTP